MNSEEYETILKNNFPVFAKLVQEQGWNIKKAKYYPEAFGDAYVVLESKDFNIRIGSDKSQVFIYVGKPGVLEWRDKWYNITKLLRPTIKKKVNIFLENELVVLMRDHLNEIPILLNKDEVSGQ
jgi:hypothetical protein